MKLDDWDPSLLPAGKRTQVRLRKLGFIFQTFNLLPTLTALENVALPMRLAGMGKRDRLTRAKSLLDKVGLADKERHLPRQLSGGERQRVAIARALANGPELILADEPTGNLDTAAGRAVMAILADLHREGRTVVLVTHNEELAATADRVLRMRDGRLDVVLLGRQYRRERVDLPTPEYCRALLDTHPRLC